MSDPFFALPSLLRGEDGRVFEQVAAASASAAEPLFSVQCPDMCNFIFLCIIAVALGVSDTGREFASADHLVIDGDVAVSESAPHASPINPHFTAT